jgi:hypothetical protein
MSMIDTMSTFLKGPMKLNNYEAIYGLRNLFIGDGEETRIGDMNVSPQVTALVNEGEYREAYTLAIRESLLPTLSRSELEQEITKWVQEWTDADEEEVSVQDLLSEYDRM